MLQKKQFKYVLFFNFFLFSLISIDGWTQYSKVPVKEVTFTNGTQEFYLKSITKTDASGNIYTGGATLNSDGNYDVLIVKTSPTGAVLWIKQYAGVGNGDDALVNFVIDASNNVFVVGTVYTSATNKNDIVTIKYNSSGVQQWLLTYNAPANGFDIGADIVIGNNNIYVTGGVQTTNGLSDFATIKYNSAGVFQWVRTYDSVGLYDGAQKITYVNTGIGQITVAGGAQQDPTTWKYAARKYDANGVVLNTTVSGGSASGVDEVHDITKDAAGNVYLTGSIVNVGTGNDMYTVKLSATDLSILWTAIYNSSGSQTDKSNSVTVDASNNVYITGYSQHATEGKNYTTIKYNSSGVQQWIQTYNGEANGDDEAAALLFDNNFVYITGTSQIDGNKDYYTICYTATGIKSWAIGYNGTNNKDDIAAAIAIDNAKSIIVAGQSNIGPSNNTYTTVKYLQKDLYNPKPTIAVKGRGGYLENRGQILNTNLTPNTTVKYYCDQSYPSTYIDDTKISYLFSSLDTTEMDSLHRVDMQFNKGIGGAKVYPNDLRSTYYNYYMGYMTRNGERTLGYNSIVKYGVYTNTDVIYTQNSQGYRHYIVARSGAPTANFEMQYTGQTSLTVDALGNLKIATTLGTLKQPKAKAYTMNNTTGVLTLLGWQPTYVVTGGNKVSFTYGTWPAGSTLVLEIEKDNEELADYEPLANLGWSTYVGGDAYDSYNATATDASGYQYAAGESWSTQFPSAGIGLGGTFSVTSAVWSKFDETHEMKFSTTYGGTIQGNPKTIAFDIDVIAPHGTPEHAVFLVGGTTYPNLPMTFVTGAANDILMNGGGDGFIARFNSNGQRTWARFYGGDADSTESIYSIDHDGNGNIYFLGTAKNPTNFPLLDIGGDGYYASTLPGNGDQFIGKINGELGLDWSTYYGGTNGYEASSDLVFDREQNNFYITGSTSSDNLPLGTVYYDNTFGGVIDAFITKFSSSGVLLWGTYLGGSSIDGLNSDVSLSFNNKLYFTQSTYTNDLYTNYTSVTWGDFAYGGGGDIFTMVFDAQTMLPSWASYFGESQLEQSATILQDDGNGFFLAGATGSENYTLLDNAGDYYQQNYLPSNCNNADEAFLVHFNTAYNKDWLTYFGGANSCTGYWTTAENPQDMAIYDSESESFLYLVGRAGDFEFSTETENFPRVDFDGADEISYFDPSFNVGQFDAFISMFSVTDIISTIKNENKKNDNLIIFPSPANDQINVLINNKNGQNLDLVIYNNVGQVVFSQINIKNGSNILNINTLSVGYYMVLIKDKNFVVNCGKFIKE